MEINIQKNSNKPLNLKVDDYTDNYINMLTQVTNNFFEKRNLKGVTKSDVVRELINMGIKNKKIYIKIEDIEFTIIDIIKEKYEYFEEIDCLEYLLEKKKLIKLYKEENSSEVTQRVQIEIINSFLYTFKKVNNIKLSELIGEETFKTVKELNNFVSEHQESAQEDECCNEFKKNVINFEIPEIYFIYKTNIDLFYRIDNEFKKLYYSVKNAILRQIINDGNTERLLKWEEGVKCMGY